MKIVYTSHALKKKEILKELGWEVSFQMVEETIKQPDLEGKTKQNQPAAIKFIDKGHFVRVVYEKEGDIIRVITFHVSKKGRYGT